MAPSKLTLYVDTVSPFAYQAYWLTRNDPVFKKCEVTYVPVFLGGIMKACGNTAPINIKNKDKWINEERIRWSRFFNIPMKEQMAEGFPPMTLTIMRALCALTVLHPGKEGQEVLCKALDGLYAAYWAEHRKTQDKEVLGQVLKEILGEKEAKKVMDLAGTEGKDLLAKNTDKALEDGAFGLPWFVATNSEGKKECFWGVDHIAQVTAHLGLERPGTGGWKAVL